MSCRPYDALKGTHSAPKDGLTLRHSHDIEHTAKSLNNTHGSFEDKTRQDKTTLMTHDSSCLSIAHKGPFPFSWGAGIQWYTSRLHREEKRRRLGLFAKAPLVELERLPWSRNPKSQIRVFFSFSIKISAHRWATKSTAQTAQPIPSRCGRCGRRPLDKGCEP